MGHHMASDVACRAVAIRTAAWGETEQSRLRRAREAHGHSQGECAQWLSNFDSGISPDQSSVSNWERGVNRPSGARLRAIIAYIEAVADVIEVEPGPEVHLGGVGAEDSAAFETLARELSGQRLLSDEQLAHIRAINHRLKHGPAMSTSDETTQLRVARYLGLESD